MSTNESGLAGSVRSGDADMRSESAADAIWAYVTSVKTVRRRDGRVDPFEPAKLERSIRAAFESAGLVSDQHAGMAHHIAKQVVTLLTRNFDGHAVPSTADVRDLTAAALMEHGFPHVAQSYIGHRFGLKVANTSSVSPVSRETATIAVASHGGPRRHRLNEERKAVTHKFQVGSHEGYLTVGLYDDTRQPGEIFLRMSKEGSVMSGLVDAFATSISIGLQYGVPLKVFVNKFANMRFEPSGQTQNPNIPTAKSIVDYVFRWLAQKFLTPEERQSVGIHATAPSTPTDAAATGIDRQPRLMDPSTFDGSSLD